MITVMADPLDEARGARRLIEQWTTRVDQAVSEVRVELARRHEGKGGEDDREHRQPGRA